MDDPTATINQPIEVDQQQQQQAPVNMTLNAALKKLSTLFRDRDEKELGQTLASFDYDVERTIEALLSSIEPSSLSTLIAPACPSPPPPPIVKTAITPSAAITTAPSTTSTTIGSPKKRQVCRHYLAGECYRKDCWFAHDLKVKPCKFW
jgi:multidrug efflux pump subunit AcrA (membrane-fusion protein)